MVDKNRCEGVIIVVGAKKGVKVRKTGMFTMPVGLSKKNPLTNSTSKLYLDFEQLLPMAFKN